MEVEIVDLVSYIEEDKNQKIEYGLCFLSAKSNKANELIQCKSLHLPKGEIQS